VNYVVSLSNNRFYQPQVTWPPYGAYREPLINELTASLMSIPFAIPENTLEIMDTFKQSAEAISIVSALITDILSDGYTFDGPEYKVKKAKEWASSNYFRSTLEPWLFDRFIEGNGFMYKGRVSRAQVKELAEKTIRSSGLEVKEDYVDLYMQKAVDESAYSVREVRHVAATTVSIATKDQFGSELVYTQRVGKFTSVFGEDEIIHIKDLNLDGKMYGFSRMKGILLEVSLLLDLKKYNQSFFKNYGAPDGAFVLPRESPRSPNYKNLLAQLREYKKVEERHGVLLFTGELNYIPFDRMKDVEFKSLGDWLTKILAMIYQMPPSRYGGAGQSSEELTLSNQGYYRSIKAYQSQLEDVLNSQLFVPEFGVRIKFNQSYLEDDLREVQRDKTATDVVEQRLALGMITPKAGAKYLRIEPDDQPANLGEVQPQYNTKKQNQFNPGKQSDLMLDAPALARNKNKTPKTQTGPGSEVR